MGAAKPVCFVTVSQRLCEELTKRYDQAENMRLEYGSSDGQDGYEAQPTDETRLVDFFSFRRFLGHLLEEFGVVMKPEEGLLQRKRIYTIFEEYKQFKAENDYYDEGDIVLKLVECVRKRQEGDVFQSLYLDEVQE